MSNKPLLANIPQALPRTQADWDRIVNSLQQWRTAMEPEWIIPDLLNGWVQYTDGFGPWNPPGFALDVSGRVYLRGMLKNGTLNTPFFQLPVGYRPQYRQLLPNLSSTNTGIYRVDVTTDGLVTPFGQVANTWSSIDGLSFSILT